VFGLLWSFSPWLIFIVLTRFLPAWMVVGLSLVAALLALGRAVRRGRVHLLDIIATAYFVALSILALVARGLLDEWAGYAQAGAHLIVTLTIFGSILVGHPFTEPYARESVPREYWNSPTFHAVNRQISIAWGVAFLAGFVSLLIAGMLNGSFTIVLRVAIPCLALFLAYRYTNHVRRQRQPAATTAGG
jgi:hypothetical protein